MDSQSSQPVTLKTTVSETRDPVLLEYNSRQKWTINILNKLISTNQTISVDALMCFLNLSATVSTVTAVTLANSPWGLVAAMK